MSLDALRGPTDTDAKAHVKPFVHEAGGKRVLQFSLSALQSRIDLRQPDRLDLAYTQLMMGFLLWLPRPSAIAMIGLGGGSLARFCHRQLPAAHCRVVEINPHVIALRGLFDVPPDSERFAVIQAEGSAFVRFTPQQFDVLMVDGYDIDGLPPSLSTQRFFDGSEQALQPGGMFVMNLHAKPVRYAQVVERIRRAFGGAVLVAQDRQGLNSIVFACKGPALSLWPPRALARPPAFDAAAWASLRPAMKRVEAAWQEEFG